MSSNPKPDVTAANFSALHTFLRGYFHEDLGDEYGTPAEAADQFCDDAESDERLPVAREWQQLCQLTHSQPVALNAALKTLGSSVRLNEEDIPKVSAVFARCLATRAARRVAKE